ncbi:MAG: hypothetical protein JWM32_1515 [Verrucomicrobia bacterium]|nr:hypothetical protein [Verrucomicrobiota bacterium]
MNHREPTHRPQALRRGLQCLALMLSAGVTHLLPAAMRQRMDLGSSTDRAGREAASYLQALGAPPLRFAELPPPPDLAARPPAAAPPQPAMTRTESSVAMANAAAAQSTLLHGPAPAPTAESRIETSAGGSSPDQPTPSAILPDETRPQVRAEDFLPYFQIPASGGQPGDVTLIVPVPRNASSPPALPASSATYIQK